MVTDGVTNQAGGTPDLKQVSAIWHRVVRDMAAEAAKRSAQRPTLSARASREDRAPLADPAARAVRDDGPRFVPPYPQRGEAAPFRSVERGPVVVEHEVVEHEAAARQAAVSREVESFQTVDEEGRPLAAGMVFYLGMVRSVRAAREIAKLTVTAKRRDRHL